MHITDHHLVADQGEPVIRLEPSPNRGRTMNPQYLIMHYTAGSNAESAVNWLANPHANASAHLVIAADGGITQMLPFNIIGWHAGISHWNGLDGLNKYSIGIELDNPGKLKKVGAKWISWFGRSYNEEVVLQAVHKHQHEPAGWHIFTEAQLEASMQVSQLLFEQYKLEDILGHDDIAPYRKEDPGPAFPMDAFRSRLLGRKEDEALTYTVNTEGSNLRSGPGIQYPYLGHLGKGTKAAFVKAHLNWVYVLVLDDKEDMPEREGWVHKSLLA